MLLQPFDTNLLRIKKNTNHFFTKVREINQPLPDNTLIVSIDVENVYIHFSFDVGISSCKQYLDSHQTTTKPSRKLVLDLIRMILNLKQFQISR